MIGYISSSVNNYKEYTTEFYYKGINYRFKNYSKSTKELIVTGLHNYSLEDITIPDKVGEYEVIKIENNAFNGILKERLKVSLKGICFGQSLSYPTPL